MKSLETRTDQDNAILGQNFSIFEKLEKFVSICYTGPKFFKRVLKNFEGKQFDSRVVITVQCKGDRERNLGFCINIHCPTLGQKFFYLQEARKIYSTLHTGAKFFHFFWKNWKNSKSHPNGPREGVRPKTCRNGPREGVSPNIGINGPRE